MLPMLIAVIAAGALGWSAYAIPLMLRTRLDTRTKAAAVQHETHLAQVRENPVDWTRAFFARIGPGRLLSAQKTATARGELTRAGDAEMRLVAGFKGGIEPNQRAVVVTYLFFALWIVSFVSASIIDLPIITAISGDDRLFGFFGTTLALGVPLIASITFGELQQRRSENRIAQIPFSLSVAGVLTAFAAVVCVLTQLAPIRAELEYRDQIRGASQQIVAYTESGDQTAVNFAKQHLDELKAARDQSAAWNQFLVPMAAVAEFTSGLSLPTAILLIQLGGSRRRKAAERTTLNDSEDRSGIDRAREYAELSATFQAAGVTQAALEGAVATIVVNAAHEERGDLNRAQIGVALGSDPAVGPTQPEVAPPATPVPAWRAETPDASPRHGRSPRVSAPQAQTPPALPSVLNREASPAPGAPEAADDSFDLS